MSLDLLIRNAIVVGDSEQSRVDIGVSDGLIDAIGPELAGGATAAIDMPLNAHPPTVTGAAVDEKRRCLEGRALVDMALWGGLVPGNVDELDGLAARGAAGFKAFMCSSGIDDFGAVDDLALYDGMCRAASLGLPVAVHAESDSITAGLAARARVAGRTAMRDFLRSRPAVAELRPGAVDLSATGQLSTEDLHCRHRHSPFVGRTLSARVARTLVRGRTVFADGRIVGPPAGRLLIPSTETESP